MFTASCDHRILPVPVIAVNYVRSTPCLIVQSYDDDNILLTLCGGLVDLTFALVMYRVEYRVRTTGPNLELFPCAISGLPYVNYCNP